MPVIGRLVWIILISLPLASPSIAGPWASRLPTTEKAKQPRIITVFTRDERLYVAGQNLPTGEGLEVLLGDIPLEVLQGTDRLVVTRLPELSLDRDLELVVRRGVREASVRSRATTWGFLLPPQQR